ncbi:hypothetical protein BDV39DRAFT_71465 [Aspergillus sergii]|uniref:Uncharacterized protein n=1 Tax=Aspergillus sergii TaxID=1034303 RepID=A0A5N6X4J9_9EURO|nr:hypothetical protein BDV39DRAFT_71465 [Aspergillus sergii]
MPENTLIPDGHTQLCSLLPFIFSSISTFNLSFCLFLFFPLSPFPFQPIGRSLITGPQQLSFFLGSPSSAIPSPLPHLCYRPQNASPAKFSLSLI